MKLFHNEKVCLISISEYPYRLIKTCMLKKISFSKQKKSKAFFYENKSVISVKLLKWIKKLYLHFIPNFHLRRDMQKLNQMIAFRKKQGFNKIIL